MAYPKQDHRRRHIAGLGALLGNIFAYALGIILFSLILMSWASTVHAQELDTSLGIRAGVGLGLTEPSENLDPNESGLATPLAIGGAWTADLGFSVFEIDLLYRRYGQIDPLTGAEFVQQRLALPAMVKFDIPMVEMLQAGIGIEPRLLLSAESATGPIDEQYENRVWYIPISIGADLDLPMVTLNLEGRFEFQLSNHYVGPLADDSRMHQLMIYLGGFF